MRVCVCDRGWTLCRNGSQRVATGRDVLLYGHGKLSVHNGPRAESSAGTARPPTVVAVENARENVSHRLFVQWPTTRETHSGVTTMPADRPSDAVVMITVIINVFRCIYFCFVFYLWVCSRSARFRPVLRRIAVRSFVTNTRVVCTGCYTRRSVRVDISRVDWGQKCFNVFLKRLILAR